MTEADGMHPSAAALRQFSLGDMDDEAWERVNAHLASCETCCGRLDDLGTDELIRQLRKATDSRSITENPEERRAAVQRLYNSAVGTPGKAQFFSTSTGSDHLGHLAHFQLLEVLGRGGMGVVFRAADEQLQRAVALKVISPDSMNDPVARERFLREARSCARLRSEHVVTIYQVGQDGGIPYLAMELLEGQTLEDRLRESPPLTLREAVRIGREAAAGLAAVHSHGLIHRDVKPGNIWLEAPSGRVKLLDFGLARATGANLGHTRMGDIAGTPEYMSPEQARGDPVDARSDLFSLGAVLYTMCAREKPFRGNSLTAVLTALAADVPRPVAHLNPEVPLWLSELIERLLHKDRMRRPGTAEEVRLALEGFEVGEQTARPSAADTHTGHRVPTLPELRSPQRYSRRFILGGAIAAVGLGAAFGIGGWLASGDGETSPASPKEGSPTGVPLRIGVLHSRTGTMALSERPIIEAVLLAVEEINGNGGVLNRPVEAVLADGQSDETIFAREAERLIRDEKVCAIFGCWTSASRKAVVPVMERYNHLLFYPIGSEGGEQSPNVVYLGPVPNQRILPALRWLVGFVGKRRWYLVGSDYVFPVTTNAVIRDVAESLGCEVVGEDYLLLGSTDVSGVVQSIKESQPDLIVNTINGDTNIAFVRELRRAGIPSDSVPLLSTSISVDELGILGSRLTAGDYLAQSYFQSLETPQNRAFLRRFEQRYGTGREVSSPMATAYTGVRLWAEAVTKAGAVEPEAVRQAVRGASLEGPLGKVQVDPDNQHLIQTALVGQLDENGKVDVVYESPVPVKPTPFPKSRSREDWERFLTELHKRWGGRWSNSGS